VHIESVAGSLFGTFPASADCTSVRLSASTLLFLAEPIVVPLILPFRGRTDFLFSGFPTASYDRHMMEGMYALTWLWPQLLTVIPCACSSIFLLLRCSFCPPYRRISERHLMSTTLFLSKRRKLFLLLPLFEMPVSLFSPLSGSLTSYRFEVVTLPGTRFSFIESRSTAP